MTMGRRIEERLGKLGMSQAELARRVGMAQPSIHALIKNNKTGSRKLHELARALETTPEYLMGETDDPAIAAVFKDVRGGYRPQDAGSSDLVDVAEIDLRYGLGAAYVDSPTEAQTRSFSRAWLRNFTHSVPGELFWARGQGDSMAATIQDNDILLIDRGQNRLHTADLIWAFTIGEVGMIKRLRPMSNGSVKILSDNPAVPPDTAVDGELHIVGRVVAVVKRV